MGTSMLPEMGNVVIAGGGTQLGDKNKAIKKRQRGEILRGQMELERMTFISTWRDLAAFILPRRPRFTISDVNKGDRRNQNIIDSTATEAVDVLRAGMMSGMTSPARPWFRLVTGFADLDEQKPVQEYLHEVQLRMQTAFLRSNLYNKLPVMYGDMGVFGTGAIGMFEDDDTVFRFFDFPVGSYAIANDGKLRVRTFVRTLRYTVQQMVDLWGDVDPNGLASFQRGEDTTLSLNVQNLYTASNRQAWVDVCHIIQPNLGYDGTKIEKRFKQFEELYYELGSPNAPYDLGNVGLLSHGGYNEFPILVGRWEVNSEDIYATNSPGMKSLGDIRQLQMAEKRAAQGLEKSINPPLTGPARLMNTKVSVLPGDVTYDDVGDANQGIRPIYQYDFARALSALEEKQQQVRSRINQAFKKDLFLMFADSDRRDQTATEVLEKKEEKLLGLGPVLWQFNQDVLDPLIERAYYIMQRKGLLPTPPPELSGMDFHPEYISIMAQAQKAVGIAAIERFAGFVNQIAQTAPDILDTVDDQELVQQYADATGVPPKILRDLEAVNALRAARQQQQQAAQAAQNAPKIAAAAADAGKAPEQGSPLSALLATARARQTVNATAQPVASVLP